MNPTGLKCQTQIGQQSGPVAITKSYVLNLYHKNKLVY
jgi:hypothetical protein